MSSLKEQGDFFLDAYSSNTRQLGCVISRKALAEVFIDFTEELKHTETNPMCKIRQGRCTSRRHSKTKIHQRSPYAPKCEDRSQEETEWQEQGARKAAWRLAKSVFKIQGEKQSSILLILGKIGACLHQI